MIANKKARRMKDALEAILFVLGIYHIQSGRVIKNEKLDISGNFCIVDRSDYVGSISRAIQVKGHQIT